MVCPSKALWLVISRYVGFGPAQSTSRPLVDPASQKHNGEVRTNDPISASAGSFYLNQARGS